MFYMQFKERTPHLIAETFTDNFLLRMQTQHAASETSLDIIGVAISFILNL